MRGPKLLSLFAKFARYGVLHRDSVRGDEDSLERIIRSKFVKKVYKKGKVFYELTEKAVGALEDHRKMLVCEIKKMAKLFSRRRIYDDLLNDLRFVDEKQPEAKQFIFLGDLQLNRPVVLGQLKLAKLRYYSEYEEA